MLGLLAALAAFVAVFSKGGAAAGWAAPSSAGLDQLRALAMQAGLTEQQTRFLALVAFGESRFRNLVGRGDPSLVPDGVKINQSAGEAAGARKAYERNADRFAGCGHPAWQYGFGSGGWFALFPANGLAQLDGTDLVCLSPYEVFDPIASLCMAYGFARGLMGWSQYQARPTPFNLRVMWGWPAKGNDPEYLAKKRPKIEAHAKAIGLPASFLDEPMPRWPRRDLAAMYAQLQGAVA